MPFRFLLIFVMKVFSIKFVYVTRILYKYSVQKILSSFFCAEPFYGNKMSVLCSMSSHFKKMLFVNLFYKGFHINYFFNLPKLFTMKFLYIISNQKILLR